MKLRKHVFKICRKLRNWNMKRKNHNVDFSIICNNCTGAMITHDLGIRFNTPTVNLFIYPKDYLYFLENLDTYLSAEIKDITDTSAYPIGLLNDSVEIHFLHYKSFNEAFDSWHRRAKRVNKDNLYVVFVERYGCTYDDLKRFDLLPFKKKVAITHKPYQNIACASAIPGYENEQEVGIITNHNGHWLGKMHYDRFDWIEFLN